MFSLREKVIMNYISPAEKAIHKDLSDSESHSLYITPADVWLPLYFSSCLDECPALEVFSLLSTFPC